LYFFSIFRKKFEVYFFETQFFTLYHYKFAVINSTISHLSSAHGAKMLLSTALLRNQVRCLRAGYPMISSAAKTSSSVNVGSPKALASAQMTPVVRGTVLGDTAVAR
jgi:hypothetical protein